MYTINRRRLLGSAAALALAGCTGKSERFDASSSASTTTLLKEARMIPYDEFESKRRFAETSFGKIAYVEMGSGDPAIFLHGLGINSYIWTGQLSGLASQRRCIALDLMAHGETQISPNQDVSFTAQADMLLAFADAISIDTFDLIGNDSGGAIAQIAAVKAPNRVKSLVLTNCDVHDNWPPAAIEPMRQAALNGALADRFAAVVAKPALIRAETGLAPMVFERPNDITDKMAKIFLEPLVRTPERRAAFNRYVGLQDHEQLTRIEADLRKLRMPCLILWGTDDIFFETKWAYWLQDALPNTRPVVEFEGAMLFFPFERPERVNAEIQKFWRDI